MKCLSYIGDAWCLKVKEHNTPCGSFNTKTTQFTEAAGNDALKYTVLMGKKERKK